MRIDKHLDYFLEVFLWYRLRIIYYEIHQPLAQSIPLSMVWILWCFCLVVIVDICLWYRSMISELQFCVFWAILEIFTHWWTLLGESASSQLVILLGFDERLAYLVGASGVGNSGLIWQSNYLTNLIEEVYFIHKDAKGCGRSSMIKDLDQFQSGQSHRVIWLFLRGERDIFQSEPFLVFDSLNQQYH